MRIVNFDLNSEITSIVGLSTIKMTRLKDVVVLAGKNGSGKTRILDLITVLAQGLPTQKILNELRDDVTARAGQEDPIGTLITYHPDVIAYLKGVVERGNLRDLTIDNEVAKTVIIEILNGTLFQIDDEALNELQIVQFVPKNLNLSDTYLLSNAKISENARKLRRLGIENCAEGSLSAIQAVITNLHNARRLRQEQLITESDLQSATEDHDRMQEFVKRFLRTSIGVDTDGYATIFGMRLGQAKLSEGQRILIQFCMALYAQNVDTGKCIIVMDEPENHLHPAALMEVVKIIHANIGKGQLWIATHSIHVISHFEAGNVWYVEDNNVSYAGSGPGKVIEGLLGNKSDIDRLNDYLSLPAKIASENFAFQCLFCPTVAFTGKDDPQTKQIHEIIADRIQKDEKLKILDFGIGKGRLISAIFENERLADRDAAQWLDYYGYDQPNSNSVACENLFKELYDFTCQRYFDSPIKVLENQEGKLFDFIIMCNTLHEIDPDKWVELFSGELSFMPLLKPDGFLLIVEDQLLAVGEKAHSKGFLVLDNVELKKLFNAPSVKSYDYYGNGRLKAHLIPSMYAANVTPESKVEALKMLSGKALWEIQNIRNNSEENLTYSKGKIHSFWVQQFANASLALGDAAPRTSKTPIIRTEPEI